MLRTFLLSIVFVLGTVDLLAQEQEKTPSKELTQYVRDAQKAGMKDDQIQQNAVKSGWPEGLVKEAMDSVRGDTQGLAHDGRSTGCDDSGDDGAQECRGRRASVAGTGGTGRRTCKVRAEECRRRGARTREHRKAYGAQPGRFR